MNTNDVEYLKTIESPSEGMLFYRFKNSRLKIFFGNQNHDVLVYVDDQVIGFIQEIKFNTTAEDQEQRAIEFVLPQYPADELIDREIKRSAQLLQDLPFVKVSFKKIMESSSCSETVLVKRDFNSSDVDFEKSLELVRK